MRLNPPPMSIEPEFISRYDAENSKGHGFAVGDEHMTPREAAVDDGFTILHEDCEGRVLCRNQDNQLVLVCDVNGPWGCFVGTDRAALHKLVLDYFCALDEESAKRRLYKDTECGAWIEFEDDGVNIGSIVEGTDACATTVFLSYNEGFDEDDINEAILSVEDEVEAIRAELEREDEGEDYDE
jgi:hypothetical protein